MNNKPVTLWDFVNQISYGKNRDILDYSTRSKYSIFMINRAFSQHIDTVLYAQEMNLKPLIDKEMHFDFMVSSIRSRKRFGKWAKADPNKDLEMIQTYYNFNIEKSLDVLKILSSDQLEYIRNKMDHGGTKSK